MPGSQRELSTLKANTKYSWSKGSGVENGRA